MAFGQAKDNGKFKVKVVASPLDSGVADATATCGALAVIEFLRNLSTRFVVVDRGHRHSDGSSVVQLWFSLSDASDDKVDGDNNGNNDKRRKTLWTRDANGGGLPVDGHAGLPSTPAPRVSTSTSTTFCSCGAQRLRQQPNCYACGWLFDLSAASNADNQTHAEPARNTAAHSQVTRKAARVPARYCGCGAQFLRGRSSCYACGADEWF